MGKLVNILLLVTTMISALRAAITTTFTVDLPHLGFHINQIGTSSKAWLLSGPNLMIFDFVKPNGGFSAPALDQIITPLNPGDWNGSFIHSRFYGSQEVIIIPRPSKLVSVILKTGAVLKTYTVLGFFFH